MTTATGPLGAVPWELTLFPCIGSQFDLLADAGL